MILVVALLIVEFNSRLMINYQCTVGNLSVAGILLCGYNFCLSKKDIVVKDFFYSLYFASIAIISGTRGYLVICMGMMVLYCFLFGNRVIRIFCICFFLVLFMLNVENFMELFFQLTRLKESTGRRKSEDLFVWNYMIEHPKYMFFGVGFGRTVGSLKGITNIINKVSNTAYTNYILYKVKGFHNFFTTIYYSSGIVGLTISAAMIVKTFKKVNRVIWDRKFRLICLVYLALYVSMLWFRWSATSGIIEFFTLSYLMYSSSMRYKIKAEL